MTTKAFRVETETLALIDRYLKMNPEGHKNITQAIVKCITELNDKESSKHPMVEASDVVILVTPKKEYKKIVVKKHGKKGPYKVNKIIKSFAQKGEGFYTLEDSEGLYPTDWFREVKSSRESSVIWNYLLAIIVGMSLVGGGYSAALMQYIYLTRF